jgi:hypothetical protein
MVCDQIIGLVTQPFPEFKIILGDVRSGQYYKDA